MSYFVKSKRWNVLGDELSVTLCEHDGKIEFRQPHFERAWTEMIFDSEYDALTCLRKIMPDRTLTVLEDTGKVVSTYGHESGITGMVIKKDMEYLHD